MCVYVHVYGRVCACVCVCLPMKLVKRRLGETPSIVLPPIHLGSALSGHRVSKGTRELPMGPDFWLAISMENRHRCQMSTANMRLFRYNLVSHPADINILIGMTIFSNNLTMLTHAEQMGWGRGPASALLGEGSLAKAGWPAGGAEWTMSSRPTAEWLLG